MTPAIPSVDEVLRGDAGRAIVARFGHKASVLAVRAAIADIRGRARHPETAPATPSRSDAAVLIAAQAAVLLEAADAPRLQRVFNLTGTVLHTNLGRAILAEDAIAAATSAMRSPAALEFDLATGKRGERDDHVRELLIELTGAEDAIVVNNNAAAVLLVLNALATNRGVIVSRGELIEIGGAFRMPDIMARAGTKLVEVGTTNRTHLKDYEAAIGPDTAMLLKVHTSNYLIQGFTKDVSTAELQSLARAHKIPLVDDLGSGTLVDLTRYGLRRERTVQDALGNGADLVTFSGDKLLGGPQAGFIVGRRDLVRACATNPIKRVVRIDKVRLAALEATLRLYRDPDRLTERLPTLRYLTRSRDAIRADATLLAPKVAAAIGASFDVSVIDCASQIGSGALPLETLPSAALRMAPRSATGTGRALDALMVALRKLPIPIIGRIEKDACVLDLRCLDDVPAFLSTLARLELGDGGTP